MIVEGPDGTVVSEQDLDEEVGRAAIAEAKSLNLDLIAYRHSELLYERKGPEVEAYIRRVKISSGLTDFEKLDKLEFTKTIIFSDHDSLESVKKDFEKRFSADRLTATYSDPRFLEFMGGGVDKGRGLREVCGIHGIDPKNTAAMGDGWNDLALLQASGEPWVMGGASQEMKALFPQSRIALSAEEDGAAVIMEAMLG
jgi:hydroxymethylpyrimidine pyrophosphatase-like HAD family hydrolase